MHTTPLRRRPAARPPQTHRLLPGEALSLMPRPACRLRVIDGRLWLTQTGVGGDRFLQTGEELVLAAQGRVVIEADGGPTAWCLLHTPRWQRLHSGLRTSVNLLRGLWSRPASVPPGADRTQPARLG